MQLVPLSTDGRVTALGSPTRPVPGPLRVVLEPDNTGVRIVALGHGTPRPVGRLGARDVAAYGPVLLRLAERGFLGTCPARFTIDGTLELSLAPAAECVLHSPVRTDPRRPPPARPALDDTPVLPGGSTAGPPALALPARRRRSRHLLGVTGAVVGVLVLASALGNSGGDDGRATTASALPAAVATPAPPPSTRTTSTTPEATPTIEAVDEPVLVAAVPAPRKQAATPRSTTTRPTTARAPMSARSTTTRITATPPTTTRTGPTRTTTAPAPRSATPAKPQAAAKPAPSGCDPNYSGCVPIASDVDCEGGSGNGPAYVRGPVRVTGSDVYGLDNDDDGIGCEKN